MKELIPCLQVLLGQWLQLQNDLKAYEHARNYDSPTSHSQQYFGSGNSTQRIMFKETNTIPVKRDIPPQETKNPVVTQSRGRGKCFKCQEPWVLGHGRVCKVNKQLYLVTMEEDEALQEEPLEATYSTPPDNPKDNSALYEVSMHALNGPNAGITTFTLQVKIGSLVATAGIDNGNTTTFMSPKVVQKAQLDISNHEPIQVTVANGVTLYSAAQCFNQPYKV